MASTLKEKISALFAGRNGLDMWNYIIAAVDVVLIVVSMLTNSYLPLCIAFLLLIMFLFRALSRNLEKRQKECRFFTDAAAAIVRHTHVYKKCPACRKVLRVKRRKGPKDIHCPYCNNDFRIFIRIPGELDKEEKEARKAEARAKK